MNHAASTGQNAHPKDKIGQAKASTLTKTFSRETSVAIEIGAPLSVIWELLTDAPDYPRWNSTVISLEGNIEEGSTILLKSILDPKRTFSLKVKEVQPQKKMVWGHRKGNRTYRLDKLKREKVYFTMVEKIGGPLFPLYAKFIPSFDKAFEQFAKDLKIEAETTFQPKI